MKLMRPHYVAFFLVGLMLIAPAIGLSESVLEDHSESETSARSSSNALLWGAQVAGSGSTDSVQSIEMDALGRTYVCGYFYNSATFGNTTLTSSGSYDIFVGRLSNGMWDWVQKAGGSSSDQCQDIAVDDGGNITITGYYYSSSSATFGSQSISGRGSNDIFVSRLDSNGNWLWTKSAGSSSSDYGYGVAMDAAGNAYLTGYYYSTAYFGSITLNSYSYDEAFLAKLDNAGNFVWAKRFYGSYYQRGRDIDVNANGDIAVTGEFSYRINIDGTELSPSYQSSSYYRVWVAKFTNSGQLTWAKMAGYLQSSYSSYGESVGIDDSGNVSVSGRFQYLMDFNSNNNHRMYAYQQSSNWDCFVAKWDSSGAYQWAQNAGGSSTDYCYDLDVDKTTGNLTIAGMYYNTAWFGNSQLSSSGSYDAFIAHVPSTGGWDWMKKFGGSSSEYGYSVAMRNGMYAFGGYFNGQSSDGTGQISFSSSAGADGFILMYGADQDGDGIGDQVDDFPWEPSQWTDTDGDGFGDNLNGWQGDSCPTIYANSTLDRYGCPDADGDGWSDAGDDLPNEPTQWVDDDEDGFGENPDGVTPDTCPNEWGDSWRDRLGCRDLDSDGQSDLNDYFMNNPTQWSDSDLDGLGDNWANGEWNETRASHWPGIWVENATMSDPSPLDFDGDGFEDLGAGGPWGPYDDCIYQAGTSVRDMIGCIDSDGDGWSDDGDAVDDNPTQWEDADGDGFGDNPSGTEWDACTNRPGTSTLDRFGCPDNDGDGWSNDNDECPSLASILDNGCPDSDGDGWVDDGIDGEVDDCPEEWGQSTVDRKGCPDADSDGTSDANDPFHLDPTQWSDEDEDGFGDEPGGNQGDDCLNWAGTSDQDGVYGCADGDGDGWADQIDLWNTNSLLWSDSDLDGYADQRGDETLSDDCPEEYGTSNQFYLGCPDMDGDGWPDMKDADTDGDGYLDMTELSADPPSNPLDPLSIPADADNDFVADHEEIVEKSSVEDPVIQGVIAVLASGFLITLIMAWTLFASGKGKRKEYEGMLLMVEEAEGFAGLSAVESELDSMLESNRLGAGQGLLLKDRIESRRFALEDDIAGASGHKDTLNQASGDEGIAMIQEHGKVTTWGDDSSQWTAEQQAWYAEAKQWGGYYDADGNWVPIQ